MQSLIVLLMLPLALLNVFGGLIAFGWLLFLGEWKYLGIGIVLSIGMPYLFLFVELPSLGFTYIASRLAEKKFRALVLPFTFLATLWTQLVIMLWCFAVVVYFVRAATPDNYIPMLLWGYSVAMAPISYMAKFDGNSASTGFLLLIAQIACVGLIISFIVGATGISMLKLLLALALIMPVIAIITGLAALPRNSEEQ